MVLRPWRPNLIWKLLWNDSGVILEILEINPGSFFNAKVHFWTYVLLWNSYFANVDHSEAISQHLLINLDLGPTLKCAPGHDSIKDSTIIKSYWLKVGLVHFQNQHISSVYFVCSTLAAINGANAFPGNPFVSFNWSPILQVSRIGYLPEIGFSSYLASEFPGNLLVQGCWRRTEIVHFLEMRYFR